jgi:hypothetical protein
MSNKIGGWVLIHCTEFLSIVSLSTSILSLLGLLFTYLGNHILNK